MTEKTLYTETGTATLYEDGSMLLDNSGYLQRLTPSQVQEAWNGFFISFTPEVQERIRAEGYGVGFLAEWDGSYWDFGDEQHSIPTEEQFLFPPKD